MKFNLSGGSRQIGFLNAFAGHEFIGRAAMVMRPAGRFQGQVRALRATETVDALTAPSMLPLELLFKIENRIMTEAPGISRVMYDISAKPAATIEWE